VAVHRYEFEKGARKWYYLERNRAWALLSNLQLRTLALLAPVLLATEAAIVARAIADGWLREKLRAWASLVRHAPELRRWRRSVQARRRVSDAVVLGAFAGGFESDLIDAGIPRWANGAMERYRDVVVRLLAK
jgi:hypothetical protein